jgi:HSP20 family protein
MSDIEIRPYDWFKRYFSSSGMPRDLFERNEFEDERIDIGREMQRIFNQIRDIQANAPKELVREYQTPEGNKMREVGPIIYGYSMTIGPDGKPQVREFGNVRPSKKDRFGRGGTDSWGINEERPQITSEREPLADVNVTDKEVRVVLEMPGVMKENIKVTASENLVEVLSNDPKRKYHKIIEIPSEANIEAVTSKYNNGILEISFDKNKQTKPKGKEIKID